MEAQYFGEKWPWYEIALGGIVVTATTLFVASSVSHMAAAWMLRDDFNVAARSPLLGIISGSVAASLFAYAIFRVTLCPTHVAKMIDGSLGEVLTAPLISLGFTCVYGARGLRLLVMYNRQLRGRWVRVLDERAVIKSLMAAYLSFEGFAWSAILLYGLNRIARMMFVVSLVDMLLTVGMCGVLAGKLRKTDDIFDVSMELQRVGAFAMVALLLAWPLVLLPVRLQRRWATVGVMMRFQPPLWYSNILPIRAVLRGRSGDDNPLQGLYSVFPYVPWRRSSKVAIEASVRSTSSRMPPRTASSFVLDPDFERVLVSPPLLAAFEDFCRRGLCVEVLQFLMAALDFEKSLRTAAETNDEVEFDTLVRIVDQYVREKSLLGVNMGAMTAEDVLKELTLEEKLRVLGGAAREAGRTLQDNIFYRFRETEEYRQIDMLLSPAAASDEVGEGRVPRIEQRGWHGA